MTTVGFIEKQSSILYHSQGMTYEGKSQVIQYRTAGKSHLLKGVGDCCPDSNYSVNSKIPVFYSFFIDKAFGIQPDDYISLNIRDELFIGQDESVAFRMSDLKVSVNGGESISLNPPSSNEFIVPKAALVGLIPNEDNEIRITLSVTYATEKENLVIVKSPIYGALLSEDDANTLTPPISEKGRCRIVGGILSLSENVQVMAPFPGPNPPILVGFAVRNEASAPMQAATVAPGSLRVNLRASACEFVEWVTPQSAFSVREGIVTNEEPVTISQGGELLVAFVVRRVE